MAEPLKNSFGLDRIDYIADLVGAVHPIDRAAFRAAASAGYDQAELMARSQLISDALAEALPTDRGAALDVLTEALETEQQQVGHIESLTGVEPFRYLPIVQFIRDHGLDHFEQAMRAQYEVTQRFTAEFSMRPFLVTHTERTLELLTEWTADRNEHVRRLVSEGTRPRLPWAPRLKIFVDDPTPVIALLDRLVDDPSEYVRRSVANNLNDISKDHPDLAIDTALRWACGQDGNSSTPATPQRVRLVERGLRTLIKAGNREALGVIGHSGPTQLTVASAIVDPTAPHIGDTVRITATLFNPTDTPQSAVADLRIHYVKANGTRTPKVFKGKTVDVEPAATVTISKKIALRQMSTRSHHPGRHDIDIVLNGVSTTIGSFDLRSSSNDEPQERNS